MPGTFAAHPAGPPAQTLLDALIGPWIRLLVVKAQLFEQSSGRVEPGQLALRPHDSWAQRRNLEPDKM